MIARVALSDRIARLNGETVRLLLLDDLSGFKVGWALTASSLTLMHCRFMLQRLVGISLVQCVASAVMAPLLLYLTRKLSLLWRHRLHNRLSTA